MYKALTPAIAVASKVFPQPVGPCMRKLFGTSPWILGRSSGYSRNWHLSSKCWRGNRKLIISSCISFHLCKPFNNCLYSPVGVCESENRIIIVFWLQCNPLISTFYISTFLYIDTFSNSRIFPSLFSLKNFSYIDLLYLPILIYRHVFGKV